MAKVCMLGYFFYDMDDRVKRYVNALNKNGITSDVLCFHYLRKKEITRENGNNIYRLWIPSFRSTAGLFLRYVYSFLYFSFILLRLYFKNHYDVIHVHNMPDFLVFTALIPKLLGVKLILDIHDPMPEAYMSKYGRSSKGVRLMVLQEKFSTNFSNAVITANKNFKKNLVARGLPESKVTVINNIPDLNIFDLSKYIREDNHPYFTLIYPGTIEPRYGLEVAIRAMPMIVKEIKNIRLLIIGVQRNHVNYLISLVEKLGMSSHVEFKKPIPYQEIPKQLINADIGIYPAVSDPHMSIATPTKVLEYAAMGIPIISSRLPIIEDLFSESSILLFEPGNSEEFAKCVIRLYSDQKLYNVIGENAHQEFRKKFVWQEEQKIYLDMINNFLK